MEEIGYTTGERLETFICNANTYEHLHRYTMAIGFAENKTVLDIASGEGYGSNLLSKSAAKVYGVDIDKESIEKARRKYTSNNLIFKVGSADAIPLENESVDVVVSFETLEHHDKHQEMFKEIKRVLKPSGILIISTPEKRWYSDENNYRNPFHVKELYFNEFKSLVNTYFSHNSFYFQNSFRGSVIVPEMKADSLLFFEGDYNDVKKVEGLRPLYLIAVASNCSLSSLGSSVFTSPKVEIIEERHRILAETEAREAKAELEFIKKYMKNNKIKSITKLLLGIEIKL